MRHILLENSIILTYLGLSLIVLLAFFNWYTLIYIALFLSRPGMATSTRSVSLTISVDTGLSCL